MMRKLISSPYEINVTGLLDLYYLYINLLLILAGPKMAYTKPVTS
jgi:hypothetical protein